MKVMTPYEKQMFKEQVIREYKQKHSKSKSNGASFFQEFLGVLRKIAPLNVLLGLFASFLLVQLKGWEIFLQLLLTGIIWITLISTALAALSKRNK